MSVICSNSFASFTNVHSPDSDYSASYLLRIFDIPADRSRRGPRPVVMREDSPTDGRTRDSGRASVIESANVDRGAQRSS